MLTVLKKHFGYDSFRPLQEDIINRVLQKGDSLVLMPTGGGKSLCFQLPSLLLNGITLVISPLISLMKDQVDALRANGVPAAFLNSSLDPLEIRDVQSRAENEEIRLLYLAPERFALAAFRDWLKSLNVALIAIDEAHCISEWGHDFRPDYRNLTVLREYFPDTPLIALTATATEQVRHDIARQLALRDHRFFISSFNRPNLRYEVRPKRRTFEALVPCLRQDESGSTIIYCFSRRGTEDLAERLNLNGFSALPYHAGLDPATRHKTQERFIRDETRIIVATIAFGMGIDKPDVRLIVHYDLPKSIEGYYQETGRAGRDGLPSRCVLFYSYGDTNKHRYFIRQINDAQEKDRAEAQLQHAVEYAELKTCRRKFLLRYFGEDAKKTNCQSCDICAPDTRAPAEPSGKNPRYDLELFDRLRQLRKKLADERRVPPFVIFGDRSLQDMASFFPHSLESFSQVYGVGQSKLRDFGQIFLECITQYAAAKGVSEKERPSVPAEQIKLVSLPSSTHEASRQLLNKKLSLGEVAKRRGLVRSTILNHIEILSQTEADIHLNHLRPPTERFNTIQKAFKKTGSWQLAPVLEILGEGFSYEELRLVRIFLRADQKSASSLPEHSNGRT
ncbi:MAG: RecQ family ATP-dependent DNA helicase [bacterium]|nr:RecQ family ATP-dependent DNA helicase [bacterium]